MSVNLDGHTATSLTLSWMVPARQASRVSRYEVTYRKKVARPLASSGASAHWRAGSRGGMGPCTSRVLAVLGQALGA